MFIFISVYIYIYFLFNDFHGKPTWGGNVPLVRPAVISFLEEELSIKVFQLSRDGPGRLRVPASELRTRATV